MIELTMPQILAASRALFEAGELHPGSCRYNAPCAIGAALTLEQREDLEARYANTIISELIHAGEVHFPNTCQEDDAQTLQSAFDQGGFLRTLLRLEVKYAELAQ